MCTVCLCCFFFFKQKTAYEMRISDWSSDVCSSDLHGKLVSIRPAFDGIACQPLNPSVQLYRPRGNVAALYVADHGSPGVTGGMMTCLETLAAASGDKAAVAIFSHIAVGSGRRRPPFAFNQIGVTVCRERVGLYVL